MMAASSRLDRQLMRQRGAAARDAGNVDFGLDLEHGRQQRHLMRQRGAGNRNVNNVDFGLVFAGSNQPRKSRSKTPQAEHRPASGSSKTPARPSRGSSVSRSIQRISSRKTGPRLVQEDLEEGSEAIGARIEANSKRRKLADGQYATAVGGESREPLRNIRQSRASSKDTTSLPENQAVQSSTLETELTYGATNNENADKENTGPTSVQLKDPTKRAKRDFVEQGQSRQQKQVSTALQADSVLPSVEIAADEIFGNDTANDEEDTEQELGNEQDTQSHTNDVQQRRRSSARTTNANAPKRRKKRKSVVLGRKKRRSTGNTAPSIQHDADKAVANPDETYDGGVPAAGEAEARSPSLTPRPRPRPRKVPDRLNSEEPPWHQTEADEDEDETYMPDEGTPEQTPAPKRRRTGKTTSSVIRADVQPSDRRSKSSFPVLTHRMSNIEALPTIAEVDEGAHNDEDDDHLPPTFSSRKVPNGVDVLAQICRETIATAIERMQGQRDPIIGRAELKRKRTALEAFESNVDDLLFEMSEAVEQRLNLEGRLRKLKREKTELQTRWIEVRRQREQLALKCDRIRRQHWEDEERAKRSWEISEAAMRTEMELERGDGEEPQESLTFMIRSLAETVSLQGGKGGALTQLRAFNASLEGLAMSLERR